MPAPLTVEPLGDQGVLLVFAAEGHAQGFARTLLQRRPDWLTDLVVAYHSVAVFYNLEKVSYQTVADTLRFWPAESAKTRGRLYEIPCCYDLGPDLARAAELCQRSVSEFVALHSGPIYTVYAIGFVPGFPYLGYLPERIAGVPRLASPRPRVEPGSVGVAGRQTGIYPSAVPGGWHLIGRTPLVIADLEGEFFPLQVGDRVRFRPISVEEFRHLSGQRLDERWLVVGE
jgi:inhibitor of KinA